MTDEQRDRVIVHAPTEIDLTAKGELQHRLSEIAPDRDLILDLRDVEFCDSTALAILLTAQRRQVEGGGTLRLRNPSAQLLRLLSIADLSDQFDLDQG